MNRDAHMTQRDTPCAGLMCLTARKHYTRVSVGGGETPVSIVQWLMYVARDVHVFAVCCQFDLLFADLTNLCVLSQSHWLCVVSLVGAVGCVVRSVVTVAATGRMLVPWRRMRRWQWP